MKTRTLFTIDFVGALTAGSIYLLIYQSLTQLLSLPSTIVDLQIIANFAYGSYGAVLFVARIQRTSFYRFLVYVNFSYALLIGVSGLVQLNYDRPMGAALLVGEGLFIAILARLEHRSLTSSASSPDKAER
ncbi:MAG: hypothetical protein AAB250_09420 [Bdellovibrionota bacterium]